MVILARPIFFAFALLWRFASLCHKAWLANQVRNEITPELAMLVVGSLRIGGGGRTPITAWLAKEKVREGLRVCILCYSVHRVPFQALQRVHPDSNWQDSSDEAVWLACSCDAPVYTTRNRWEAWKELAKRNEFDLVISDDGLEDPRLNKALRLLLDWGERGNSLRDIFPIGSCRSLRKDHVGATLIPMLSNRLSIKNIHNWEGAILGQEPAWVLSAIGDPGRFHADLRAFGVSIAGVSRLRDHSADVSNEAKRLLASQPYPLVVTEKDWVKLSADLQQQKRIFVVHQCVNAHGLRLILAKISPVV